MVVIYQTNCANCWIPIKATGFGHNYCDECLPDDFGGYLD